MKRAHRPVPILVPQSDKPRDFKLTDSGVFEEGGIVISKAGCVINKAADASSFWTGAPAVAIEPPGSCRPGSCSSATPAGAATDTTSSTPAAAAEHSAASSSSASTTSAAATATAEPAAGSSTSSCSTTDSPSSSGRPGSSQAAIALDDLQELTVIGRGSSGVVKKVLHNPSGAIYVLKVINFDMGCEQVRRQVTTEVKAMDGARHPHIVAYHQSYFANGAMTILMEFMDGGSLWDVLQRHKSIPEPYLPELARQVLLGLAHLHDAARICHRDIKPSNLLLSSSGQLKISDFGVSSQLSNSMSKCLSWVGTVTYMSPERIQGHSYSFNTDVWSLGLLLLECAVGRYPYPPEGEAGPGQQQRLGFWELLEYIVVEPAPRLPGGQFSAELVDFVGHCLQKDAARRPSAAEMLSHPFITRGGRANLSDLLGPAPLKARAKGAAAAAAAPRATAGSSSSSRRPASSGSAATVTGSRIAGVQRSSSAAGGRAGIRGSSMAGSTAAVAAEAAASRAAAAVARHNSALAWQLARYTNTQQAQRAAPGSIVKVCTPPKQQQPGQQVKQQQFQQQVQRQPQLRQQLHPDLQQHLLSRMQVAPQPQPQRHVMQQPGQLVVQQHQQQRQVLAQQQSMSQRQGLTPQEPPSQQQQKQAGQPAAEHQGQITQLHRPMQHLDQQHRGVVHTGTGMQQQQQQARPVQQAVAASSGPLTALKPTPRKAPVAPPARAALADMGVL